jgi:G3E family GTPase
VKRAGAKLNQVEEKMVEMQNGCICCTLREDLLIEVKKLAEERRFDYLVIESTGISEPLPIAETFTFAPQEEEEEDEEDEEEDEEEQKRKAKARKGQKPKAEGEKKEEKAKAKPAKEKKGARAEKQKEKEEEEEEEEAAEQQPNGHEAKDAAGALAVLSEVARLDTMVTVLDARNFSADLASVEDLSERYETEVAEEDERSVSHLLIDQIEFADVVVLNKTDLVGEEELRKIRGIVRRLNPEVRLVETTFSRVDPRDVVNTGLFSFKKAAMAPGWLKEIRGEHVPETVEYGITSFVYRRRRPFHPARLHAVMGPLLDCGVVRSKGFFWLATQMKEGGEWNGAGEVFRFASAGPWFCLVPREMWPDPSVEKDIEEPWGDRRQEIVFIGVQLNRDAVERALDECLLSDEEMALGPEQWKLWEDPFEEEAGFGQFDEEEEDEEEDEDEEEEEEDEDEDEEEDDEEEEEEHPAKDSHHAHPHPHPRKPRAAQLLVGKPARRGGKN